MHLFVLCLFLVFFSGHALAEVPPVRIGVLTDMSGSMAGAAGLGSVEAAQMAVEDMWKKQGTNPRQVIVINADYQNRSDLAAHISESWIEQQGVNAVFDAPNPVIAHKLDELFKKNDRLLFTSCRGPPMHESPCPTHSMAWLYDRRTLTQNLIDELLAIGKKRWFILGNDDIYSMHVIRHAKDAIREGGGIVAGEALFGKRISGLDMVLEQSQKQNADIVFLAFDRPDILHILRNWPPSHMDGYAPLAISPLFISDVHELDARGLPPFYTISPFYWNQDEATQKWAKKFARRTRGSMPSELQASVYVSVKHYLEALPADRTSTPSAVLARFKSAPLEDSLFGTSQMRGDGFLMHRLHLLAFRPKNERSEEWDYFKIIRTTQPEQLSLPEPMKCGKAP